MATSVQAHRLIPHGTCPRGRLAFPGRECDSWLTLARLCRRVPHVPRTSAVSTGGAPSACSATVGCRHCGPQRQPGVHHRRSEVAAGTPDPAAVAGWVDSDFAIPIELESFERECSLGARSQLVVPRHWPDEVATVISHGRREAFSVDGGGLDGIARLEQVLRRERDVPRAEHRVFRDRAGNDALWAITSGRRRDTAPCCGPRDRFR